MSAGFLWIPLQCAAFGEGRRGLRDLELPAVRLIRLWCITSLIQRVAYASLTNHPQRFAKSRDSVEFIRGL